MKAWKVKERGGFEAAIVFAEIREKARVTAQLTDACNGVRYIDIEVHRCKEADKYYRDGKTDLDWYEPEDRLVLVKDFGFPCDPNWMRDCTNCSAQEYCDTYQGTWWLV